MSINKPLMIGEINENCKLCKGTGTIRHPMLIDIVYIDCPECIKHRDTIEQKMKKDVLIK